jgi:hypothetical protein
MLIRQFDDHHHRNRALGTHDFSRPELLDAAASAPDVFCEMPVICERLVKCRGHWTMPRHTHKATTRSLKELWAKVANECLERTGDEGRAIREANAVIARQAEVPTSHDSSPAVIPATLSAERD